MHDIVHHSPEEHFPPVRPRDKDDECRHESCYNRGRRQTRIHVDILAVVKLEPLETEQVNKLVNFIGFNRK